VSFEKRCDVCDARLYASWPDATCGLCQGVLQRIRTEARHEALEKAAKVCDALREGAPNLLIERVLKDTADCIRALAKEPKP
jgi:hypothetical protein